MGFKDNPVVFLTKKLWEYSKGNRGMVAFYFLLFTFANVTSFFEPLVIAKVLNIIQEMGVTSESLSTILLFLLLFLGLELIFWIFHGPARVIEHKNAFLVRAKYKKYLLDGTMNLPAEWHTDHHSGDTIDKINKGSRGLYHYAGNSYEVIETFFRFLGSYFALVYFNFHSSYIVLFMVFVTVSIILKIDKILIRQHKKINKAENVISAKVYDLISNVTTVIILRIEKLVSKDIYKKIMTPFKLFVENRKVSETKWFLVSLCTAIMTFLVLSTHIYLNFRAGSAILIGTVYVLYDYTGRISDLFFRFAYRYGDMVVWRTRVANAEEISNEFRDKKKYRSVLSDTHWRELKIDSLGFSYHEDDSSLHLEDVSMVIKKNQKIALIGESGSGKTTFLKVIRELYEPRYVNLYLDGNILKNGFKSISEDIALIPQDPEIFNSTIRENITMGINHNLSYIKVFTDLACFTEVVDRLPKGFNSSIVEKGVNLSSGEKQRLALARGLLACEGKEIVLLDEPTSSVDSKNEMKIYQNIFTRYRNKTIISSIHRLHLLPMFDAIYFFKSGRIIASGDFDELLKKSFEFRRTWNKYNRGLKKK